MDVGQLLADLVGRVRELVPQVVEGLDAELLARPPQPGANPVAWLVWHQARVMDDHVADAVVSPQVRTQVRTREDRDREVGPVGPGTAEDGSWADRFALDLPAEDTGYGHGPDDVARVRVGAGLLTGYADAVAARALEVVEVLQPSDLDRVVDEAWDPPVTVGVRLVSVASDCLQHLGQASYARGLLGR